MGADFLRWVWAGARATGVGLTERAVALTRSRVLEEGRDADVRVADAEMLPFSDGSFDIVYSWAVLHHTPNPARALAEAQRVLAPNGKLKLMLYHRHSWVALAAWTRFCLLRGKPWRGLGAGVSCVESAGTQAFTVEEVRAMLTNVHGLTVRPVLTHWDRRCVPFVTPLTGNRFGWFLLIEGENHA